MTFSITITDRPLFPCFLHHHCLQILYPTMRTMGWPVLNRASQPDLTLLTSKARYMASNCGHELFEFRNTRNKIIVQEVYGEFLSIAHSLVPQTCSKVYKPYYDTGTNNTLFVYLLFCKNLPSSISKPGFVLLHTFNGWHTFDHFFSLSYFTA